MITQDDAIAQLEAVHTPGTQRAALAKMALDEIYSGLAKLRAFGHSFVLAHGTLGDAPIEWPKMLYHHVTGHGVVVASQEEADKLGSEYAIAQPKNDDGSAKAPAPGVGPQASTASDEALTKAFAEGEAAGKDPERGVADNPHFAGSPLSCAWMKGFIQGESARQQEAGTFSVSVPPHPEGAPETATASAPLEGTGVLSDQHTPTTDHHSEG